MKNRDIAIMLCFLPTGWFGVHKYYVGKKRTAILYAVFIWTLIPIVKSVFDGIILLLMDDEKFMKKHHTKEEYDEYVREELKKHGIIPTDEKEESKIKKEYENVDFDIKEPDYSDYYGPWK